MSHRKQRTANRLLDRTMHEMMAQDGKWGWPRPKFFLEDDTVDETDGECLAESFRAIERRSRQLFSRGRPCWMAILGEEIGEVARETDPETRIVELVQVAAVVLSWAQAIEEKL